MQQTDRVDIDTLGRVDRVDTLGANGVEGFGSGLAQVARLGLGPVAGRLHFQL